MSAQSNFDKEEDFLAQQFNDGLISRKEYDQEMKELQRDYRAMAEDAAREAAEIELNRWYS